MVASLGASCPSGGSFYICEDSKFPFIGCCTKNPCDTAAGGKCPQEHLRPASFSKDSYENIYPQQCDSTDSKDSKAEWFTCASNNPPFLGCCKTNPCLSGSCPTANLVAARLSSDEKNRQAFLGEAKTSTTSTTSSATETGTSSTVTPSSTSDSNTQAPPAEAEKSGGLPKAAIIGIGVGLGAILLAIVIFFIIKRRRNTRYQGSKEDQISAFVTGGRGAEYKPVSTFSTPEPLHMAPYSAASHLSPYSAPSHLSPYPSPINSPYDPHRETKMRVISQVSEVSQVSDRTTSMYGGYQPSSIGSPNMGELDPNATGGFGGTRFVSELPADEASRGKQKPGQYQELQG
ncbi:hypothetical protein QBC38DRAFT_493865 [Podospora fimiseda]|uniref:Mid2 domain-containing protein n=1 Tax=Podospora fimiseda TaxID=252190 RepID=A0AAN6YKY0_9PEZI|nr:hypothetical protein QBC38DRAFT_493865 [Podospora fimiseda]